MACWERSRERLFNVRTQCPSFLRRQPHEVPTLPRSSVIKFSYQCPGSDTHCTSYIMICISCPAASWSIELLASCSLCLTHTIKCFSTNVRFLFSTHTCSVSQLS
ncbi:hypothetical protein AG1IA_05462 [Rhizoctonia solani AG-1 IA]|uniref:Uncharacterized protein n=1 Tax=Thanatephorus cucumeris (strain AG1-IA) TaxID=983506 RepID=L8WUN1_THACA|nr:hypothetical protein AG1IA_05462 [Rhizoctonia solani AG-1 IA]